MSPYTFQGNDVFPTVTLDKECGIFHIKGRSTPDNAKLFFEPSLQWMDTYASSPNPETNFVFQLEHFNISSSKIILFILYKLHDLQQAGHKVSVTWCYNDAYLLGAGRDYAYMVKVPFEFKKIVRKASSSKDLAA